MIISLILLDVISVGAALWLLIDHGADVSTVAAGGFSALDVARQQDNRAAVVILSRHQRGVAQLSADLTAMVAAGMLTEAQAQEMMPRTVASP